MRSLLIALSLSSCLATAALAVEHEQSTTLKEQSAIAVTIYNKNLALIKDQRTLVLKQGFNHLAFRGVSARIRPETALLRSLDPEISINVLEQNFDFDLLTPQKLLEKYTGKQVQLVRVNPVTGEKTLETVRVLSTHGGITLKVGDSIITNPQGEYVFDDVPDNLRDQPTLVTQLTSSSTQQQTVELAYLTGGLSWKADYVAELSPDDSHLDLTGWVTLNNQSGTHYNNAKLQLVAGDVNQVSAPRTSNTALKYQTQDVRMEVSEESLFEYHLYNIARPTTLADKQTKQVSLLSAQSVPVTKQFLLAGHNYYYSRNYPHISQKTKVAIFVQFKNTEQDKLGLPLPKGIVRVYKNDSKGNAQFVGEDKIDHTPKNEGISLKLGNAFDITADKKQVDFKKVIHTAPYSSAYESAYEITLKNAKSEPVTVTVREPIPADWAMLSETHPHQKVAAGTAEWQIIVPAESSETLKYKVLVKH